VAFEKNTSITGAITLEIWELGRLQYFHYDLSLVSFRAPCILFWDDLFFFRHCKAGCPMNISLA
jgi:hypothetical protein